MRTLTLRCDSEYSVWSWGPVDIWRVSDRADVGPIIIQSSVDQRDGGVPACWASLPQDTTGKLTVTRRERPWGEVEKLEKDAKRKTKNVLFANKKMGVVRQVVKLYLRSPSEQKQKVHGPSD